MDGIEPYQLKADRQMINYDKEYFFLRKDGNNPRLPFLVPDINTGERWCAKNPPLAGSAPLIFFNGWKDEFAASRIKDDVADVLFDGTTCIVRDHIHQRLLDVDLPGVFLHPSIYIDDQGDWHEDFWYVGISNFFDCWDRGKSKFDDEPMEIGDQVLFSMCGYTLDSNIIDSVPARERLLFRMGGTMDGIVTCHTSIAGIFRGNGLSGAILQPVGKYGNFR